MAQVCDELVLPLLLERGFDRWGILSEIARELGVHRSPICRYRKRILQALV
jgi:hypothetical protein